MWLFGKKKTEIPKLTEIIKDKGALDLSENKAQLRVWLPEMCKQALKETARAHERTASNYLREFFVAYLYGEHERLRMYLNQTGLHYESPPKVATEVDSDGHEPMYSRGASSEVIPGLGKNICPIKIFLPGRIKQDLHTCADKVSIPLSTFVREILVSHLLGHTLWSERLRTWTDEEEQVGIDWEEGRLEAENIPLPSDDSDKAALKREREVERY